MKGTGRRNRACRLVFGVGAGLLLFGCAAGLQADIRILGGPAWGRYADGGGLSIGVKPGYLIGIGWETTGRRFGWEADILYFLKTSRSTDRGWHFRMPQISVPVMLRARAWRDAPLYFLGGGEIAWILSHKQDSGPGTPVSWDATEFTGRVDAGLVGGVGAAIRSGRFGFSLEGRYHLGLVRTTDFLNDYRRVFQTREFALVLAVGFGL